MNYVKETASMFYNAAHAVSYNAEDLIHQTRHATTSVYETPSYLDLD